MYPYNIEKEPEELINAPTTAQAHIKPKSRIPSKSIGDEEMPVKADDKLLEMLNEAIESEIKDASIYELVIDRVSSREDKEIIRSIKMNAIKAEKLLSQVYKNISEKDCEESVAPAKKERYENEDICEVLTECMFDCLKDIEYYKKLYFAFINQGIRDILYEIITDNQSDSIKLLYMETKYRTSKSR